ncbi:MAG: Mur ligase family protein [Christensenellales bacterium]
MIDTYWVLLLWLAPCLAAVPAAKGLLHIFQLGSYQFGGYLGSLKRRWKQELLPGLILFLGSLGLCVAADRLSRGGQVIWLPLASLLTILLGLGIGKYFHAGKGSIKRLQYTARIKRLVAALSLVMLALGLIIWAVLPVLGLSALLALFLPLWVALAALLVWPLEQAIKRLFMRDAGRLLDAQKGLIRIGITGSYGKTSVKFFLETLLRQRYSVLATRASFNTPMGIARVIREDMQPAHRVFIAEMGARHRGDIRELCRLVQPSIGILTAVGPQHLETFHSIEKVRDTKYDLIASLPLDGFALFYNDGGICRELYDKTNKPKAIVGQPGDDLWAEDLSLGYEGSAFTLCLKDGTRLKVSTSLCGEHNVRNILLAAACARHLGLSDVQLQRGISQMQAVQARFKPETLPDGTTVINNGFNASPESSRASLQMLAQYPGRKIVVTPGFVELGALEKSYHEALGSHIASAADIALLIGHKRTLPIRESLVREGFDPQNIHVFISLKEAQGYLDSIRRPGDIILYENDLPDQYSEK